MTWFWFIMGCVCGVGGGFTFSTNTLYQIVIRAEFEPEISAECVKGWKTPTCFFGFFFADSTCRAFCAGCVARGVRASESIISAARAIVGNLRKLNLFLRFYGANEQRARSMLQMGKHRVNAGSFSGQSLGSPLTSRSIVLQYPCNVYPNTLYTAF